MQSGAVIKGFDVIEDGSAGRGAGGEAMVIDQLVFEAAPERFDKGVIVAVPGAAHGGEQTMLGQDLAVSGAGELTTPIGVNNEGSSGLTLPQGHAQGGDGEWGIEDRTHGPADHPPAADIEDCDQIQPALAGENAGGIGDPDLVGTTDFEALETVRCDRSTMAAIGGGVTILGALAGKEAFGTHEPGDAVTPPGATERTGESRAAISLTAARELLSDPRA